MSNPDEIEMKEVVSSFTTLTVSQTLPLPVFSKWAFDGSLRVATTGKISAQRKGRQGY